jgi:hypothetical protein
VPFGFFISIAAGDSTLPLGGAPPYAAAAMARDAARVRGPGASSFGDDDGGGRKRSRNLLGGLLGQALQFAQGLVGHKAKPARSRSEHTY